MHNHRTSLLLVACLLAGCPSKGTLVTPPVASPKATAKPSSAPGAKPTAGPGLQTPPPTVGVALSGILAASVIARDGAAVIARDGASVIARDGAGVIARDGASLTGTAKLPAGLIGNDGSTLIGNDGSTLIGNDGSTLIGNDGSTMVAAGGGNYRLAALPAEVPIRKGLVYLVTAKGELVLGVGGEPLTATTDADGRFAFEGIATTKNLLLAIPLERRGFATAILPRAATQVTVDLASSLSTTYVHEKYVKGQADPVATLEKLPADLEAAARGAVAKAVAATDEPPAELGAATIVARVEALRKADAAVEAKLEEVRKILVGGLSDQGAGQPADDLETDASDLAVAPDGQILFSSPLTLRVWRKDAAGKLAVVAGSGFEPSTRPPYDQPAPGDGGPAARAPMFPTAIAYDQAGALLIADASSRRIRRVGADGTIRTVVGSDDWEAIRDLVVEPDGSLLVATHAAIWRVAPGGQPALLAGAPRPYTELGVFADPSTGDGGPALDARFRSIGGIARDPRDGSVWAWDAGASIRRIKDGKIERALGTGAPAFSGDGGPAAEAAIGYFGTLAFRADGRLLLADSSNLRIREVADGKIATIAGNGQSRFSDAGPALSTGVSAPGGMTVAPDGAVLIADRGYVRRIAGGEIRTLIGGNRGSDVPRPATAVQLLGPKELAYEADANAMLVADGRHVWRLTLDDGKIVSVFGGGRDAEPFTEGQAPTATALTAPSGLIALGGGRFAVVGTQPETAAARVVEAAAGKLTTLAGGGTATMGELVDEPAIGATMTGIDGGLAKIGDDYYKGEGFIGRIGAFRPGGRYVFFGGLTGGDTLGGKPAKETRFYQIKALGTAPDGQLYVGTPNYIYRVDMATTIVTHVAGAFDGKTGSGVAAKQSDVNAPSAFAWDADGRLYWAEPETGLVRRLGADGLVLDVAGRGTPLLATESVDTGLGAPAGLAFDKAGDLYVADVHHGQIKVIRKADLPQ